MSMIGQVDWTDVEVREENGSSRGGDDSTFLKFAPGKFRVRCVGKPYFYLQTFIPSKMTGADRDIALISPGEDKDPLIKLNILPSQRGAINVLHRDDGNKLKVMRFGPAIYKHIREYAIDAEIDPADLKKGIDFMITVTDPGGKPRSRQYTVTPLSPSPITKEEAAQIKTRGGLYDLDKLFMPTPLEKINEYIEQYGLISKSSKADTEDVSFEDSESDNNEADDEDFTF